MDLEYRTTLSQIVTPQVATADVTSSAVNMAGFAGLNIIAAVGVSGDTLSGSVKIELEVQESDDNSTYTAVADASITNAVTGTNTGTFAVIDDAAEDDALYVTKYNGNKQYVKVVANLTGTHTNGTPIGVIAVQDGEGHLP